MSSDSTKPAKEIWNFRIGVDDNGAICSLATSSTIWYFKEPVSFEDLVNKYQNVLEVLDNIAFDSSDVVKRARARTALEVTGPPQPPTSYLQLKNEATKMLLWIYRADELIFGAVQLTKICGLKRELIHGHLSKLNKVGILKRVSRGAYQTVFSVMAEEEWVADALKNIYAR